MMDFLHAFAWLGVALLCGKLLRRRIPLLKRLFIPGSILGGIFLLVLGPEVLGRLDGFRLLPQDAPAIWSGFPGFLINIVFAGLFLGKTLPSLRTVWRKAGPQVAFSHTIAWGQYAAGFTVTALVLVPLFGVNPLFGTLIEIGFIGGHGTAAGLGGTFSALGWEEGLDLALGMATVGVLAGVLCGIVLVNYGVRRGHTRFLRSTGKAAAGIGQAGETHDAGELDLLQETGKKPLVIESMEPLSYHLACIAAAIGIGALLLAALTFFEENLLLPLGAPHLFTHVPLFPLAMIGGVVVEKLHGRLFSGSLDRSLILRIQGTALDLLIVTALASLTLRAIAAAWLPLLILVATGLAWTIAAFLFLAPRMLRDCWFERGIGDFGQSLGVTATGLLLMRIVDPQNRSPAFESFGYKQLLFEPLMGGGLFTAVSMPLVHAFGLGLMLPATAVVCAGWLLLGLRLGRQARPGGRQSEKAP